MSRHTASGDPPVEIRPIRPEDEPLLLALHGELSEEKLRPPSFGEAMVPPRDCLVRLCRLELPQDAGFVALEKDAGGDSRLLGVSRYFLDPKTGSAELALEVIQSSQAQGLSDLLLKPLIAVARERGVHQLVTGAQGPMIGIATRFGFLMTMRMVGSPGTVEVVRDLEQGIDLRKYDVKRISKADVRLLVSSLHERAETKEEIQDFFRKVDPAFAVGCLDELIHDSDPELRHNALQLLVFLQGQKALPWIERCLGDEDVDFRSVGCSLLAEVEGAEAVPRLLRCLREDPSVRVRGAAVEGLAHCGDRSVIKALREAARTDPGTDDEGPPIRELVAEAIERIRERTR